MDSGLTVPIFLPIEDPIAYLNKAMAFIKLNAGEAQESGQVLNEEHLAFLADPGITNCHDVQPTIIHIADFQTDDLDAYDSKCDDISSAKAVLMANLLSYGSDVVSERGLQAQVRVVRTDKGTEFLNQSLHAYFAAEGIQHQISVARTPEQNDVVERRNRTLVEAARTMLCNA
nr:ribonuclease H-like domain-containing protein [Tanacetum cinerariifolium]